MARATERLKQSDKKPKTYQEICDLISQELAKLVPPRMVRPKSIAVITLEDSDGRWSTACNGTDAEKKIMSGNDKEVESVIEALHSKYRLVGDDTNQN